jgi:hypothetical protein
VDLSVEPVNGRLPEKIYPTNQQKARGHLRFVATPEFDSQEFWKIRADIKIGDGSTHSLLTEVESTPPGLGPWDLLVYLAPFVLFGGLWAMVFVRKSRRKPAKNGNVHTISSAQPASRNHLVQSRQVE